MTTETTHLKKIPTAGDSDSTDEKPFIWKRSIYQPPFCIVVGSLLAALLVLDTIGDKSSGGQRLESSVAYETNNAGELAGADNVVITDESALTMDIFGMSATSESEESVSCGDKYKICKGFGKGNCCDGLQCTGLGVGTCQYSGCVGKGEKCLGFGKGNCCKGGCYAVSVIPGLGYCD